MAQIIAKLGVQLPWWWRIYLGVLMVANNIGVLKADAETATNFVMKRAHFYTEDVNGRRKFINSDCKVDQRTQRYFERAPIGHHVCPHDLDLDRD